MVGRTLSKYIHTNFEIFESKHALAILRTDFPEEYEEIRTILKRFRLYQPMITEAGGGKSLFSKWYEARFKEVGWSPKRFHTGVTVDGSFVDNPTHEIDLFKGRIGLEIEWNNKDPFFDRDLNNFRILFNLDVLSVGVIITRSTEIIKLFYDLGRPKSSTGKPTTHMGKLIPRLQGGGAGGCPILAIGVRRRLLRNAPIPKGDL